MTNLNLGFAVDPGTPATNDIRFAVKQGEARFVQGNGTYYSLNRMGNCWSSKEIGFVELINRQLTNINSNLVHSIIQRN